MHGPRNIRPLALQFETLPASADTAFNGPTAYEHRPLRAESARLWAEERLRIERLAALRSQLASLTEQLEALAQERVVNGQSSPALARYVRCILGKMGSRLELFVDKPTELAAIAKILVESFIADEEQRAERHPSNASEYQEGHSTSAQATIIAWPGQMPTRHLQEPRSHEAALNLLRLRMTAIRGALHHHRGDSEGQLIMLCDRIRTIRRNKLVARAQSGPGPGAPALTQRQARWAKPQSLLKVRRGTLRHIGPVQKFCSAMPPTEPECGDSFNACEPSTP